MDNSSYLCENKVLEVEVKADIGDRILRGTFKKEHLKN